MKQNEVGVANFVNSKSDSEQKNLVRKKLWLINLQSIARFCEEK